MFKVGPDDIVAFDLETATLAPEGPITEPMGITCGAVFVGTPTAPFTPFVNDGERGDISYFHGKIQEDGTIAARMDREDIRRMVDFLFDFHRNGNRIVGWNSLRFDFLMFSLELRGEPDYQEKIRLMCLNSFDPAYQQMCVKGFMGRLDSAAQALGVPGKEGVGGVEAVSAWAEGRARQDEVLKYVGFDVIATANVFAKAMECGNLRWTTRAGKPMSIKFGERTVAQCFDYPPPDQKWMTNPVTPKQAAAWLFEGD